METCRLPIHVRFIFCNLSEASVRMLANSLLKNSSLIGFSCLFNPCMITEELSYAYLYHSSTSSAAQCVRDAVIRTLAPLQIWDNKSLPQEIILFRERLKLRTLLCSLPFISGPIKYLPVEIIRKILSCSQETRDSEGSEIESPSSPHSSYL